MLKFYKTIDKKIREVEELTHGCWINVTKPTPDEIRFLTDSLGVEEDFIQSSLDPEEKAHVEVEENQTLVILDIPIATQENKGVTVLYTTAPIGIVLMAGHIVTISLEDNDVLHEIKNNRVKGLQTNLHTRFFLTILLRISVKYLYFLRKIERISGHVEEQLHQSMKNKELIQLLGLEKSLVYFSTSLKANEIVLEKILKGRVVTLYEADQELLEDVIIEVKQAIEMSNIYSSILSGTMDAFASVISNNLNIVMKVLTSITIVMSIPNMVFSFYGMNVVGLPFANAWVPILISFGIMGICFGILKKKNMI